MDTFSLNQPVSPDRNTTLPTTARTAVAALFFINGVLFATWVSRIPAIREAHGLSHEALGFVLFGLALGALIAMPIAGWCVSRFGSRRTCLTTALAACAVMPSLALAPGFASLTFALFCFGAMHGAFDIAMNAQAVVVEERYGRPIMSSFHALWSLGALVGAALGGMVAEARIAPFPHFATAALLFGIATVAFAFPRLLGASEAKVPSPRDPARPRKFVWPPRRLLALGGVAFCIMLGEGAMADWSAIFLRDSARAGEAMAAAGYAAFSLTMAATRFSGDVLSARFGAATLVRAGSALAAIGLAFALIVGQPIVALLGFAAVGAGFATIVPQVFSAAGRIPGVAAGPALATATTIGYCGFLIGPPLIGFAAGHLGLRAALGIVVAMSAAAAALAPSVGRSRLADRASAAGLSPT